MLNSSLITLNGKYVVQRRMEAITNNLANALTAGYKLSKPVFKVETKETGAATNTPAHTPSINGLDTHIYFSEAPLVETGNTFDLAIEGNGFFAVSTKNGARYTRNGQFTINQERKLVTMSGDPVMGQNGEISIPMDAKDVKIEADGSIYVTDQMSNISVGALKIVDFKDKTGLRSDGASIFFNENPMAYPEITPGVFAVKQGFYEASNVNVMTEMVDMINVLRAYESYMKVDQSLSEVISKLVDVVRL